MRNVLNSRVPSCDRVLLIESGSRHMLERFVHAFFETHRPSLVDLVTCYAGNPEGLPPARGEIYRVGEYAGRRARGRLYAELAARRHSIAVLICSGEPIMTKWKWALALRLPVKVLIVNEHGDYFWFDRTNWSTIRRLLSSRMNLSGTGAIDTAVSVAAFPFALAYLLLYTAWVHLRRKVRA